MFWIEIKKANSSFLLENTGQVCQESPIPDTVFSSHITSVVGEEKVLDLHATAYLDCLLRLGSSRANMCTVPWSLDTHIRDESWLKLIL